MVNDEARGGRTGDEESEGLEAEAAAEAEAGTDTVEEPSAVAAGAPTAGEAPPPPGADRVTPTPRPPAPAPPPPSPPQPLSPLPPPPVDITPMAPLVHGDDVDLPPPASVPLPRVMMAPKQFPAPVVEDLMPTEGSVLGGTKVTLLGRNLLRQTIVRFGGTIATTVSAQNDREMRVLSPPASQAGAVDVTLQNPGTEPVTAKQSFRFVALAPPKITSVAPNRGAVRGGTELSIIGDGFVRETVVLLDGVELTGVKFVDRTTLELRTPPGTAGKLIDVGVRNPDGKEAVSRRAFMYDERYR